MKKEKLLNDTYSSCMLARPLNRASGRSVISFPNKNLQMK